MISRKFFLQVHIENFGAICTAFGPCAVVPGGDTVAGGFLDRIKKAMESGMFFGTISVKNSLNLLKGKEPGSTDSFEVEDSHISLFGHLQAPF